MAQEQVILVVSDTSPVRALIHVNSLHLLRALFKQVWLPDAVVEELCASGVDTGFIDQRFFVTHTPADVQRVKQLQRSLDVGESAAIALALELRARAILMDEAAGRGLARQLGLIPIGVLGVLAAGQGGRTDPGGSAFAR